MSLMVLQEPQLLQDLLLVQWVQMEGMTEK